MQKLMSSIHKTRDRIVKVIVILRISLVLEKKEIKKKRNAIIVPPIEILKKAPEKIRIMSLKFIY